MTPGKSGKENISKKKGCAGKKKAMFAYGVIQISTSVVSAISLAAIAVSLCVVRQQSKAFNTCIDQGIERGLEQAQAVRYCNGG